MQTLSDYIANTFSTTVLSNTATDSNFDGSLFNIYD